MGVWGHGGAHRYPSGEAHSWRGPQAHAWGYGEAPTTTTPQMGWPSSPHVYPHMWRPPDGEMGRLRFWLGRAGVVIVTFRERDTRASTPPAASFRGKAHPPLLPDPADRPEVSPLPTHVTTTGTPAPRARRNASPIGSSIPTPSPAPSRLHPAHCRLPTRARSPSATARRTIRPAGITALFHGTRPLMASPPTASVTMGSGHWPTRALISFQRLTINSPPSSARWMEPGTGPLQRWSSLRFNPCWTPKNISNWRGCRMLIGASALETPFPLKPPKQSPALWEQPCCSRGRGRRSRLARRPFGSVPSPSG